MNAAGTPCEQPILEEPPASDRYVYYVALPTLQDMASHRVARAIWYSYISRPFATHPNRDKFDKKNYWAILDALGICHVHVADCRKIAESLEAPSSIRKILVSAVETVCENMRSCVRHFQYCDSRSFEDNEASYQIDHFDLNWCFWLADGEIDYAKTALRILSSHGLSFLQRFAVLCELCREEEIRKFPWRLLPDWFEVHFDRDNLPYYWICYLTNALHDIRMDGFDSVDAVMAVTCEFRYWEAFKYFWNRLGEEEQIDVVVYRMENVHGTQFCLNRIMSMMSRQQQLDLLAKMPDRIVWTFWVVLDSPESAIWAWKNSKHLITPDQFIKLVVSLFDRAIPSDKDYSLFMELWHSASDQQRNHSIQTIGKGLVSGLFGHGRTPKAALDFVYMHLLTKSQDYRREAILENAGQFAYYMEDENSLREIMQLCLPNLADQLEYKKLTMESDKMLLEALCSFHTADFEKLISKIKFYSIDAKMGQDFVKQFIESKHFENILPYLSRVEKWNKFSEFVDQVFSPDVSSALDLKKQFISSYAQRCTHHWNDEGFDQTMEILEMVFTNNEELQLVKKYFLDSFRNLLVNDDYWKYFDEKYFNKFVSWCLSGDAKAVAEFIKNVPIDAIFDRCFDRLASFYGSWSEIDASKLPNLDKCLRWYFKGEQGARRYKLRRLEAFEEIEILQKILKRDDQPALETVLKWFFDDDEESASKFKIEKNGFEGKPVAM